ncbi:BTAD domain-containing putative transcriptional regulator [Streptomyces sp. NRRL B-24720]|uniref:BTAD domain-containing putative transcriptional regulator n=1 Tax=Streptomyces sp. NRRL B-24720 TaxID=1476876 RepID=UPI000D1464C0|nr:BTAD domain-containing putative transcriptional regulator [Streptomyces sp. NRRL B-24720]
MLVHRSSIESSRTLRFLTGQTGRAASPALPMPVRYRSERQAEALQVYRPAQPVLRSELRLKPCRSLRRLHQPVLTSDRLLNLPWRADGGHEAPCGIRCAHSAGVRPGDRVKTFSAPSST